VTCFGVLFLLIKGKTKDFYKIAMINQVSKFQTVIRAIPSDGTENVADLSAALRGCNCGYLVAGNLDRILGISLRIVDYKHPSRASGGVLRVAGPGSSSSIALPISPASPDYSLASTDETSELLFATSSETSSVVLGNFKFRMSFDPWTHVDSSETKHLFTPNLPPVVIPRSGPDLAADISSYFNSLPVSSDAQESAEYNRLYFTGGTSPPGAVSNVVVAVAGSVFDRLLARAAVSDSPVLLSEPVGLLDNSASTIVSRSSYSSPGATTALSRSGVYTPSSVKIWVSGPGNTLAVIPSTRVDLNYYNIRRAVYPVAPGVPLGSATDPVAAFLASSYWTTSPVVSRASSATYLADVPTSLTSLLVETRIIVE
jgi:hypothetical protein